MFAEQAELVEGSGAFAFDAEAFGQEEESPFVRNGGERFAPDLVVEENAEVIAIDWIAFEECCGAVRVLAEFLEREGGHGIVFGDVMADEAEEMVPFDFGLRDVLFGRAKPGLRDGPREGQWDGLHTLIS